LQHFFIGTGIENNCSLKDLSTKRQMKRKLGEIIETFLTLETQLSKSIVNWKVATDIKIGKWIYQLQVMNSELKNLMNSNGKTDHVKELRKFYLALYEDYDGELTNEIFFLV